MNTDPLSSPSSHDSRLTSDVSHLTSHLSHLTSHDYIVLFDGICNYCNGMVNFAIRHDKKARLKFSPIQSETGQRLMREYKIPSTVDSVILIEKGRYYTYSTAAIRISKFLDWPAKALFALIIIPSFLRQPIYKWVARNRYKWFGKKESCMIPNPDVKSRFLE